MSPTPETGQAARKRPWFQFHLSTAIVLMFVAGGLIWANVTEQCVGTEGLTWEKQVRRLEEHLLYGVGWPWTFLGFTRKRVVPPEEPQGVCRLPSEQAWLDEAKAWGNGDYRDGWLRWDALALDFAVTVMILATVACVCEWLIRRREHMP
jgi:hypothetical protein